LVSPNLKLGVALLRDYDSRFYEDADLEKYILITDATRSAINTVNDTSKNKKYELVDTYGDNPEFDYSQEFRNYPKKNLIEIQYQYKEVADKISNLFTLGILPTASWKYKIFIYDAEGTKIEIKELESELISEFWGIMIFPNRFIQSRERRIELAKSMVQAMIQEAASYAIAKGLKLDEFDSSYKLTSLPFRMKPAVSNCKSIISSGMNAPGIRTTWTPSALHNGCDVVLKFLNKTDKIINLETQQFTLVTDKKLYSPKREINLFQRNITGNAVSTNTSLQSVLKYMNLQPNVKSSDSIELFFEYPHDEKPLLIRWQDTNQSASIVEVMLPR